MRRLPAEFARKISRPFACLAGGRSRSAFGEGGKGPRNTLKTRKAKMEITNEEATRGIGRANFASVRVFSGRLVRGKLDIQTAVRHGPCMVQFVVHYVVPATQTASYARISSSVNGRTIP